MANVKISAIGLIDMLYFKNKPKKRDKIINATSAEPLNVDYATNVKAAQRHPDEQNFEITEVIEESADTRTFVLKTVDGNPAAFFRAGQYVVVRQVVDGKLIARPISISSAPLASMDGIYNITVKLVPTGFLSKFIFDNWKVGTKVTTSGPQGVFYYEGLRDAKTVVAAAGGSGITPLLSMARAIADGDENFDLTILFGTKTENDIIFAEQFAEVQMKTDKVKVVNVLSDEEKDGFEHGFISADLIKKYAPADGNYSLFAAGPQVMYQFIDGEAEKLGLIEKYYRKEIFGAAKEPWNLPGYPAQAKDQVFNLHVRMCGKDFDIPCAANETMMVALERAGIAGPNRCRGGICGWCRSKLISGDVFIPQDTDGRRAADKHWGYIHPCATFATSDCSIDMPNNK